MLGRSKTRQIKEIEKLLLQLIGEAGTYKYQWYYFSTSAHDFTENILSSSIVDLKGKEQNLTIVKVVPTNSSKTGVQFRMCLAPKNDSSDKQIWFNSEDLTPKGASFLEHLYATANQPHLQKTKTGSKVANIEL